MSAPANPPRLSPDAVDALFGGSARPSYAPPGTLTCDECGSYPAVRATLRSHRGLVLLMTTRTMKGTFCRPCGLARQRELSGRTLWQGWWGVASLVVTPIVLLTNLIGRSRFRALPEPTPGAPGQPLDPGVPLRRRPVIAGLLVPISVLTAVLVSILVGSDDASAKSIREGDCVTVSGARVTPSGCGDGRKVTRRIPLPSTARCPAGDDTVTVSEDDVVYRLCLEFVGLRFVG
ncbi:hypothetical protein [Streptomyces sp. SID3343]|uniref:hypothetical protein n=1 Tax=Streptomyces sp. SID3343 TaxID=2690260 RepID=UPI001371B539|nr:hypothetical protein [Streptomyces sp. SID3343]MYW03102.1 hypothetical protein [Streptomyces sp. SID3343]